MAQGKKKRGPKGGIKHQPGRGHDRKSKPRKQKDFRRLGQRHQAEQDEEAQRKRAEWNAFSREQQRLLRKEYEKWVGPRN